MKSYNNSVRPAERVSLMAYQDDAADIVTSVSQELEEARNAGIPVIVGVETMDNGEAGTSFYEKGSGAMTTAIHHVYRTFANTSSFAGCGIHEWTSWLKLKL